MKVTITNEQDFLPLDEAEIRRALGVLPSVPKKFKLSLVYLDDAQIAELNRRYLHREGPTDVLAFPMANDFGEVIVSAETALKEAQAREIEPAGELLLYTIHGVLHLIGYDDKTDDEALQMHAVEKDILTQLGYTWDWD